MGKENHFVRDAEGRAPGRWVLFVSLAVLMAFGLMTACATPTPSPAVVKEEVVKEAEPLRANRCSSHRRNCRNHNFLLFISQEIQQERHIEQNSH